MKQTRRTLREKKNRLSYLIENELEKAELVIAIKGITDKLQDMAEDLAKVEADDIMPMGDSLKAAFGPQIADQFSNVATTKVRELVTAVSGAKDAIGNEISRLEKSVNGESTNDMAMSEPEESPEDMGGGEGDMGGDEMPPEEGEEGHEDHEEGEEDHGEEQHDMGAKTPPMNDMGGEGMGDMGGGKMNAAGRARKESAAFGRYRGRRLLEYKSASHDANVASMCRFSPQAGMLGKNIERMIEDGRFDGQERKALANVLSHVASCADSPLHWDDPDAKIELALRSAHIDIRLPAVRDIVLKLKKLAHLISFKHEGVMDEDTMPTSMPSSSSMPSSVPTPPMPTPSPSTGMNSSGSFSESSKNLDARVLKEFRRLLKENIRPGRAVARVASRFAIDGSDVVAIVREAKKAKVAKLKESRLKKKVVEFKMKPTPASKRGMFDGVSQEELHKRLTAVKKQMKTHEENDEPVPKALRTKLAQLQFALRAKHHWGEVGESRNQNLQDVIEADSKRLARSLKLAEQVPQKPKSPADLRADRAADAQAKATGATQTGQGAPNKNNAPPPQASAQQPPAIFQPAPKKPSVGATPQGTNGQGAGSGMPNSGAGAGGGNMGKGPIPVGKSSAAQTPSTLPQMPGKVIKSVPKVPNVTLMSKPNGAFPKPAGQLIGGNTSQPQQAGQPDQGDDDDNVSESAKSAKGKSDKRKGDPCWKNYKMVGMKTKDGKKVPNCVPESKITKPVRSVRR